MKIVLTKRGAKVHAAFRDQLHVFGSGDTPAEAVWDLLANRTSTSEALIVWDERDPETKNHIDEMAGKVRKSKGLRFSGC